MRKKNTVQVTAGSVLAAAALIYLIKTGKVPNPWDWLLPNLCDKPTK